MENKMSLLEVSESLGFETVDAMIEAFCFESFVPSMCSEGCDVEPDGHCSHGHPSCLIEYGII